MRLSFKLSLVLVALVSVGCASQQTLESQAAATGRQLGDMNQAQASLAAAQQKLEARLAKLEANNAAQTARLDQIGPTSTELKNQLNALQSQSAAQNAAISALSGRADKQDTALAQAREAADDAVKIARDSRMVSGKVVDVLTLTDDMVLYSYEQPDLTAKGKAALDELIARARPQLPYIFIEVIGYSDDYSLNSQNRRIALDRAESVRRYLFEVGGIPLHRMSTISYGDLKPIASNDSIEGRSRNRRVMIQVLK